jgi:hypothetical protein
LLVGVPAVPVQVQVEVEVEPVGFVPELHLSSLGQITPSLLVQAEQRFQLLIEAMTDQRRYFLV